VLISNFTFLSMSVRASKRGGIWLQSSSLILASRDTADPSASKQPSHGLEVIVEPRLLTRCPQIHPWQLQLKNVE